MRTRKAKDRSRLIQAAMGQIPCDLTIGNVQFFNVITGEIYPASVDILDGFVVLVREEGQEAVLPSKSYYDGHGRYLIPGYIDTHMHIESTMMIPENLARAILPWGTTTICTDPHEIGNVMGLDGVRFMLANAKKSKLRQYVLAPSCVPSLPGMENAGAEFLAKEVGELLDMDDVIGIAEIMDYVGVIQDSERMHTIIDEGLRRGMFLQGHAPYCFGRELAAYRIGGPVSDHESVNADEVRAKLRAGMHINLRASSLIDNLSFLVDGCKDQPWRDFVSVCTDDVHAKDLLTVGHINNVVRKAVASGLDGREVVKMATFNAAREYGFDDGAVFEGCMPVEVMARRGEDTLRYGPLKPVGLRDPRTGRDNYAVVQLRRDNAEGTLYNIVGFQTHLTFGEQKRVFSMIPALRNAEFVRYGVMHRNTYLNSPQLLDRYYRLRRAPRIRFAGQMTGVEGYVESCASGALVGIETAAQLLGLEPVNFPQETAIGALSLYISGGSVGDFQPMNINFGIITPLDHRVRGKRNKNAEISARSLQILDGLKQKEVFHL